MANEMELVNARTLTSKTFDLGSGRRRLTTAIGPVHYRVNPLDAKEQWKDINRALVSDVAGIRCLSNTYQVQIAEKNLDLGVRALAEFKYRGKKMTLAPVALEYRNAAGASETISSGVDVKPVVSGNSVTWPDVFGKGIDFGYTVSHLGFQKTITVHHVESLPSPKIDAKGLRLCVVLSMAWDSGTGAPSAFSSVTADRVSASFSGAENVLTTAASKEAQSLAWGEYWKLHPAKAWDAGGKEITASLDVVSRGGRPFAVVGVAMADLETAKFPVSIDPTLDPIPVADGGDDGDILYGDTLNSSLNELNVGDFEEIVHTSSYMRFTNVAIPSGATIDTANIVVVSYGGKYDGGATPSGSLKGRKLANCPQITTITNYNDTTTYPRTTANVTWWPTQANWGSLTNRTSPELKTVVQEVVDLAGWASGNAIQIEWHYINNGWYGSEDEYTADYRRFYSYEHATYNPPILNVEYTVGPFATGAIEFPALTADGEAEGLTGYLTFDSYESREAMTVTADTVTITDAQIGHQYRLTKDLGAAYFDGDFTHTVQAKFTRGATGYWRGAFWGVANAALDFQYIDAMGGYALWIGAEGNNSSTWCIRLTECHAGTLYTSAWTAAANDTDYYYTITRNESVGTYGTLYAYIYSDAARTDLLATLSVTLHSKQDFRYLHGANSNYIAYNTNTYSAQFKDLDFGYHSYVAATGAVEFPLLACDADVDTPDKGVIGAFEFPLLTSEGTVVLTHTGTGEPSFPLLSSEGEATPHWFFGPGEVDFPSLTADGSVHVNPKHAVGAPEFPLLTASGIAIRPIRGAGVATFPLLEADGGQILKETCSGSPEFPLLTATGAAKRKVTATGTPEFPLLEADTVAAKTITATGTPTLPAARTKGYSLDYDKHVATGTPSLPAARASGRATLYRLRTATGAATLPAARAKGAGTDYDKFASAGTPALPAARAKGKATVYRLRTATGAVTFRLLTADGAGTNKRIDGDATFGALTADGTAKRTIAATGAPEFPALTSSTSGQLVYTGTGDVTFGAALAVGAAKRTIAASGTITFPALTVDGTEYRIVYGEGAPEFEALEASTTTARTVYASGAPSFPVPYGGMHAFNATERALQWYRVVQIQYIGNEPYKRAKLEAVRAPVMR